MEKAKNAKKAIAGLLALGIVLTLFWSILFISAELHHDCVGENCPICLEIQTCLQVLQTVGVAVVALTAILVLIQYQEICVSWFVCQPTYNTLVSLKVKLTN